MIGVGTFELGVGLSLAVLPLYFVFRDPVPSLVLVLLVVVLAPILGVVTAACLAHVVHALLVG